MKEESTRTWVLLLLHRIRQAISVPDALFSHHARRKNAKQAPEGTAEKPADGRDS
jgi:hypothetical protein